MTDNNTPHFVTSKNFYGDNEYIEWLQEIKSRYQAVRSRVALQANYEPWNLIGSWGVILYRKKQRQDGELVLSTNLALILGEPILTLKVSLFATFFT